MNYAVVGSSEGIAAISAREVDFGASDVPVNASELTAAKGGPVTQVPDALGAEGVAYNLDLPAGARLHLTGPVIAAIFLGQIIRWNDPAITALNPGITLPAASIAVVHRSDQPARHQELPGHWLQLGADLHAPTRPEPRAGTDQHAGLAYPRRPGLQIGRAHV